MLIAGIIGLIIGLALLGFGIYLVIAGTLVFGIIVIVSGVVIAGGGITLLVLSNS